jgi:hypothetical protein
MLAAGLDGSGSSQPPDCARVKAVAVAESGNLISVSKNGVLRPLASVGAFDFDHIGDHHPLSFPRRRVCHAVRSIVVAVLLGVAKFGSLIEPWFAALAGRLTTVGT